VDGSKLTSELAQSSNPPMGANMMPMAKNSGKTVLGVRIGLSEVVVSTIGSDESERFVNGTGVHLLPCFQALLPKGSICSGRQD